MSTVVAATIRRYAAALASSGGCDAEVDALGDRASAAIERGEDLPHEAVSALLAHLAEVGPADIGLRCGAMRRLSDIGIVGHAIASSRTLGEALNIALSFGAASDRLRDVRYRTLGAEWIIDVRPSPGLPKPVSRLIIEEWLTTFFACLAEITEDGRPPVKIDLAYPPPANVDYARWLPTMPRFRQRRTRLTMPASVLDRRVVSHNGDVLRLLMRHVSEQARHPGRWAERVRRGLLLRSGEPASQAEIAQELGCSVRTLVRRLAGEGTTFSALQGDYRQELGVALARDSTKGSKQIAATLGISEQSLKRLFPQWTGLSIRRWRIREGL